jgi:uncharacterized membrane protein YphA (DoxX/SURF4 family)
VAVDRQRAGIFVLRICLGVFFVFEGLGKIRWFTDPSLLAGQLNGWVQAAPSGSLSHQYLTRVAIPGTAVFARLVPLGEIVSGLAMIAGVATPLFAFVAFFMALNFHIGSGALFKYSFLTNGYGLPVLGGTLALALAGAGRRTVKKLKITGKAAGAK